MEQKEAAWEWFKNLRQKHILDPAKQLIDAARESAEDRAMQTIRELSLAGGAGAAAGALVDPEDRSSGALRGATGGILGGITGKAWGHKGTPFVRDVLPKAGVTAGGTLAGLAGRQQEKQAMTHKYAGVTLDWYDDEGLTLKDKFPDINDVPDVIKTANVKPKEKLANEDFALIAIDEGHAFRKFACYDPGTTAMSVIYFMEHGDKLSDGAQKLAAASLVEACTRFGMLPPEALTKSAGRKDDFIDTTGSRAPVKTAARLPQSDDDYAVVLEDGSRHYPINTWDRIKTAEAYFGENHNRMQPEVRRQYAVKLARKAFIVGYPLDEGIVERGALSYADDDHIKEACDMRKVACTEKHSREFLDELFEKKAELHPDVFSECLRRFDVNEGLDAGWDQIIPDPWASTYGIDKSAFANVVWESGAERVTEDALVNLSRNHLARLEDLFNKELVAEFQKDPVGIFKSLPEPQKKLLSRLASDSESMGHSEFGESNSPTQKGGGTEKAAGISAGYMRSLKGLPKGHPLMAGAVKKLTGGIAKAPGAAAGAAKKVPGDDLMAMIQKAKQSKGTQALSI